jgi:modulator of FtsH protease HflK
MAWNEPGGSGSKDPWGHRNNEQGPPDLDEIVKKMQAKLNRLFGGGRGGSGQGGSRGDGDGGEISWSMLGVIAAVGLVVWALFGFYVVEPAEQGVETRFGRYTHTTQQGLNWHIPYPIEQVEKVNVQQVRAFSHNAQMLTQDENIINVELVVQYRVSDSRDYLFNVLDPDNTLHQATESALREIVGTSTMERVLTVERERIATDTKALIQNILDRYRTGLIVVSVNMQNAQPPEAVQAAFADVIKAREDEERDKNRAQAYSNEVIQRAGGEAERLRQGAQAYRAQVVARSEGETQRFLSILREYERAPEITRQRIYLETMEAVLSNTSKIMLDVQGNNNLMMLPLDRLMGQNGENPLAPRPNPQTANQVFTQSKPIPMEDGRNRDDARSRGGR